VPRKEETAAMSTSKTAAACVTRTTARDKRPEPDKILDHQPPADSTATLLLQAAAALPVGLGGFCVLPTGEWFDLYRESADTAHARRVSHEEVCAGLLEEWRFIEAEPLGSGPA